MAGRVGVRRSASERGSKEQDMMNLDMGREICLKIEADNYFFSAASWTYFKAIQETHRHDMTDLDSRPCNTLHHKQYSQQKSGKGKQAQCF
jgi:hypothetical protein